LNHLKDLSSNERDRLINIEIESEWVSIFGINRFFLMASVQLMLSSAWMIVVCANINLIFSMYCFASFFLTKFLAHFIADLINDKSQFARFFMVFS
jgi:hypothetical protein